MSSFIFPDNGFEWRNESLQKPPKGWYYVRESGADGILKATYQNIATVWQGDFHNAKQVLSAMKKKVRKPAAVRSDADIAALFHAHRMKQAQQSRILNMLAVEIRPGFVLDNKRAPDIRAALLDVYGEADGKPFFLPLNLLLGFMGVHEWHKKDTTLIDNSIFTIHFQPIEFQYLKIHRISDAAKQAFKKCLFSFRDLRRFVTRWIVISAFLMYVIRNNGEFTHQCCDDDFFRLLLFFQPFDEAGKCPYPVCDHARHKQDGA
ncbi:methyltransferase domain protein [Neisseria gonorrhoeae]|nr:methyltransferase domain protein [Neisseria gonorrhoeae]VEG59500.1 methyltransferase domain protein [Neisseria gonorrhoeae]